MSSFAGGSSSGQGPNCSRFGADLSPQRRGAVGHLAVVRRRRGRRSSSADPLRLPFVEALFDLVVVTRVVEATVRLAVQLRKMRRVIAPAGIGGWSPRAAG